jgi:hypothetical protein
MFNRIVQELKRKGWLIATVLGCWLLISGQLSGVGAQPAATEGGTPPSGIIPISAPIESLPAGAAPATTNQPVTTAQPVSGNAPVALTAVPPRYGDDYSLSLKPGQSTQIVLEVRNPTNEAVAVQSTVKDFIIGEDGETPVPVDETEVSNRWSLASWLAVTPNNAVVEPRKSASILVTIAVPQDAMPGGHYAMVLHKPVVGEMQGQTTGAQVSTQVGTLLYVVVEGELQESAHIKDFAFTPFSEFGPVPFSFDFDNQSSMHVRTQIEIVIKNFFGKETDRLTVEQKNVFPGSVRHYEGLWNKVWGLGPYKAEVIATYGKAESLQTTMLHTFWIVPVRVIVAVLVLILIIVLIMKRTKRKYAKMLELEENKVKKLDEKLRQAQS